MSKKNATHIKDLLWSNDQILRRGGRTSNFTHVQNRPIKLLSRPGTF